MYEHNTVVAAAQVEARKSAVQEPKKAAAGPNQAPQAAAKAVPKGVSACDLQVCVCVCVYLKVDKTD
jgi:hypothetical protein